MHAEVRAQFEGARQERRGEGVIHNERGAGFIGDLRNAIDLADAQ